MSLIYKMSGYVNIASAERMSLNDVSYPYSRMFCDETPKYLGQEFCYYLCTINRFSFLCKAQSVYK